MSVFVEKIDGQKKLNYCAGEAVPVDLFMELTFNMGLLPGEEEIIDELIEDFFRKYSERLDELKRRVKIDV